MPSINDLKAALGSAVGVGIQGFEDSPSHEFEGANIDVLLEEASHFFNTTRINLDYKVIQKASNGFLGVFKRPYKIVVWRTGTFPLDIQSAQAQASITGLGNTSNFLQQADEKPDETTPSNGSVKVTIRKSGVYLKITPPLNGGKAVTSDEVQKALLERAIRDFRANQIAEIIREAAAKDIKIGEWKANPSYDSHASLEIAPNNMKAYATVTAPILSGRQLEPEEIHSLLKEQGVCFGVLNKQIEDIFTQGLYNIPVLVAEGREVVHGENAKIHYEFHTDSAQSFLEYDDDEKIDYKSISKMYNVVVGTSLAKKTPSTNGLDGCTIMGEVIESHSGQDVELIAGANTVLSEDGLKVISQIAGKPLLRNGVISVEAVHEVEGDVDLSEGSIIFLGIVIVKGNVNDGFTIKAAKNIEIYGNVGNAIIESDLDVSVKGGIQGKGTGYIKAGRNVTAKFVGNANISAGNDVIVKEEIIHSHVDAGRRVLCYGKRGTIVGGRVRAGYEIAARFLGATAYTDTLLEAGVDPKSKEKLETLKKDQAGYQEHLDKINLNIQVLQKQQKMKKLTPEKEKLLMRLHRATKELQLEMQNILEDIEVLEQYLASLNIKAMISAQSKVFPGVNVTIKSSSLPVKNEYQKVTFMEKNSLITPVSYQSTISETE